MTTTLPMFPLGSVLLPGGVLSLHVFEGRYRALVRTCIDSDDHEFGVTLIERGSEVGGGDIRRDVGTVARMLQVAELPDGRFAVIAAGVRRIRVLDWLPDDPYPIAVVVDWPDDDGSPDDDSLDVDSLDVDRLAKVAQRTRRVAALAVELGDAAGDLGIELAEGAAAVFQLAELAPIGAADRYQLLEAPGANARLAMLDQMLDDVEATQAFRMQG